MNARELARVALRYTLSGGRGQLSVFMSLLSMVGLVLAIGLLGTALSIMNGFDREMRERILALVPHITVHSAARAGELSSLSTRLQAHPAVRSVTAFEQFDGLLMRQRRVQAVALLAMPEAELRALVDAPAESPVSDGILLGRAVAAALGVEAGDTVRVLVPGRDGGAGIADAATAAFPVSAIIRTGTELDEALAAIELGQARRAFAGLGGERGLRLEVTDLFSVRSIGRELRPLLPPGSYLTDWMMTHGNLYAAIQLSRRMITVLLLSIIAVAAFNVVASLVLVVSDKHEDIAILRTMGTSRRDVATVFLMQGGLIGLIGSAFGCLLGLVGAATLPRLVQQLERGFGFQLLNTDVYPISFVPVDIRATDFAVLAATTVVMCLIAACYPAWRASRLAPAMALRQGA